MGKTLWKPMPDHPGYLINRSGWVKNERGYVVASGSGVQLTIAGVRVGLKRKQLLEIAAGVFGEDAASEPAPKPQAAPVEARQAAVESAAPSDAPTEDAAPSGDDAIRLNGRSNRPEGERAEVRSNPTRILPLRDPWKNGDIEVDNPWALQGVM
ncbi:MAG: hypothetical protein ACOZEN_13980 [Thermodesulfobacteriota bacterium]